MIQVHLMTRRCELSAADRDFITREVARLERRLRHFAPDALHLFLDVERHARREEYRANIRLDILGVALPVKRNKGPSLHALLKEAFADVEDQLERYLAKLRREYLHERKRASLRTEEIDAAERQLLEERELYDRALAGDQEAFDLLVEAELPALARRIERELSQAGRTPTRDEVQHLIGDVLATAFAELAQKPARWSLGTWLGFLAHRQIERESGELVVAQSVPAVS